MGLRDIFKGLGKSVPRKEAQLSESDIEEVKREKERNKQLVKTIKRLENERGYARGETASLKARLAKLESQMGKKGKADPAKILTEKQNALSSRRYSGALSLKRALATKGNKKVMVYSFDMKRKFGILEDIAILASGRIAVMVKKGGEKYPVIEGMKPNDLFRNFGGLTNEFTKGICRVNLNRNGDYVENIEAKEIADEVLDANGRLGFSSYWDKDIMSLLAGKNRQIDAVLERVRATESTNRSLATELQEERLKREVADARSEKLESVRESESHRIIEQERVFREMARETAMAQSSKQLSEERSRSLDEVRKKVFDRGGSHFSTSERDLAESNLKEFLEWSSKLMKPEPKKEAQPQALPGKSGLYPYKPALKKVRQ